MEEKSLPPDLNKRQLARIWQIGSRLNEEGIGLDEDEAKAEQLREYLAAGLRFDAETVQVLPKGLRRLCERMRPFTGISISDLLLDEQTDIETLALIKEQSKKQNRLVSTDVEHAAATILYYAAIAHALVYHHQKITTLTFQTLQSSYEAFGTERWLPEDLRKLFVKAREVCTTPRETGKDI